jgi:hypothetical protein
MASFLRKPLFKTPNLNTQKQLFDLRQSTRREFQRGKQSILAIKPLKKSGIRNFFSRADPKVKKEIKELKNYTRKNLKAQEKKILQEAKAASKAATVPAATIPVVAPKATQVPAATVPAATIPATTVPAATIPATTVPATTIPATTIPATTIPATTIPATTIPATTVPATTIPATTIPATTIPATTIPATTIPAATIPAATIPVVAPKATQVPATTIPATTIPATTVPVVALKATQVPTVPVATPKAAAVPVATVATPKAAAVPVATVATPKAAAVPVAAPKAAQVAPVLAAPVTRSGSARNGAAIVQVTKVPEYEGDYRLITDPSLKELEIARIDRVIAHNKRARIHDFYPDVLARMQERNMKIPDTPERIRKLHGWYLKPSELTPEAAPTTMFHYDPSKSFVGGARKRTSKHNNKKRTSKHNNKKRTKHNITSKTQRK